MMRPRITIHKGIRMRVAVDIGNTNIVLGFLDGDDIIGTYRITTKSNHTSDEYGLMITQFLALSGLRPSDIDDVIIASVVPKVMHSFRASIIKFLNINPMVVGPGIKTGINIRIDDPKSLGSDCLADCVGAYYTYGGPVLVADFGTATTFNYVNDEGVITCGLITTGIRTARRPRCRPDSTTTSSAASNARSGSSAWSWTSRSPSWRPAAWAACSRMTRS